MSFISSQMRIAVSTLDNGQYCVDKYDAGDFDEEESAVKDFCDPDVISSYLRVYAIVIGDFVSARLKLLVNCLTK
jgi:hypothetical protein